MDFYTRDFSSVSPKSLQEINERMRRRYLDRLGDKVKKLRKLAVERNWENLKTECLQITSTAGAFGFQELAEIANTAQETIPDGKVSRAMTPYRTKEKVETLIVALDTLLIEEQSFLQGRRPLTFSSRSQPSAQGFDN